MKMDIEMEEPCGPVEVSHKQVCLDLEKATQCITQAFQHEVVKNQELRMLICRLEEKEAETGRSLTEQVESNKQLKLKIDELQKHLEKDHSLAQANQTVSFLRNELRDLLQQLHNQRSNRAMQVVLEKLQGWESHLEVRHAQQIYSPNSPLQLTAAEESLEFVAPNLLLSGIKEEHAVHGYEECSRFERADPRAEQSTSSKPKLIQTSLVSSEGLMAPASDDDDDYEDDGDTDDDDDDEDYTNYSRAVKTRKRGNSRIAQTRTPSGAVKAYLLQDPAMDSSSHPVRKGRRISSAVWQHFTTSSTDSTKVICKLCKAIVSRGRDKKHLTTSSMHNHVHLRHPALSKTHLTTSSMHNHVHLRHPALSKTPALQSHAPLQRARKQTPLRNVVRDTRLPVMATCNSNKFYPDDHPTAKQITEALGEMICQDLLPFSVVENKGLLRLLAVIAPQYRVPSPMHFSGTVMPNL